MDFVMFILAILGLLLLISWFTVFWIAEVVAGHMTYELVRYDIFNFALYNFCCGFVCGGALNFSFRLFL